MQTPRLIKPLQDNFVRIDERKIENLLSFAADMGKLIAYYDLQNKKNGTWQSFFAQNPLLIQAAIAQFDWAATEKKLSHALHWAAKTNYLPDLQHYTTEFFGAAHQLTHAFATWTMPLQTATLPPQALLLKQTLDQAIDNRLAVAFVALQQLAEACENLLEIKLQFFDEQNLQFWQAETQFIKVEKTIFSTDLPLTTQQKLAFLLQKAYAQTQLFIEMIGFLQQKYKNFSNLLTSPDDNHDAGVALYVAFVQLFEKLQQFTNQFTAKHTDLYYQTLLQQKPKAAKAGKVLVYMELNPEQPYLVLPEGTAFVAPPAEASQPESLYATTQDLVFNQIIIKELQILYAENKENKKYQNIFNEGVLFEQIYQRNIALPFVPPKENSKTAQETFATFGEKQDGKSQDQQTMQTAFVGFAVASANFYLQEGQREIALDFFFTPDSFDDKNSKNSKNSFISYLKKLAFEQDETPENLFAILVRNGFLIQITTQNGWHTIDKLGAGYDLATNSFHIDLALDNSIGAVIGYDPLLHNQLPPTTFSPTLPKNSLPIPLATTLPVVRFCMQHTGIIYPYTLFAPLEIEQIKISVKAKEVKDLVLYNNYSQLNPTNPFMPFSPVPTVGSYWLIGSKEAFFKPLNSLTINIEWFGLPTNPDGFQGYYQDYETTYDNTSFTVKISCLENGKWKTPPAQQPQNLPLFRTDHSETLPPQRIGKLSNRTIFANIDKKILPTTENYEGINQPQLAYTHTSKQGFIRLELATPADAFGHETYPFLLSKIMTDNVLVQSLSAKVMGKKEQQLPQKPYTPVVQSISLAYEASEVINFAYRQPVQAAHQANSQATFFHLHLDGHQVVYPNKEGKNQQNKLLPAVNAGGQLLFGLWRAKPPETLHLLFHLAPAAVQHLSQEAVQLRWFYLKENTWFPFAESAILEDTTQALTRSGVVSLELPLQMTTGNTLLNPALHWICLQANGNLDKICKTVAIHTQAAVLEWVSTDMETTPPATCEAYSIVQPKNLIEGLRFVYQPLPSFGYTAEESQTDMKTRVNEHLKHKQRAVTAWDYEHLLFQKFPYLKKVKCLPHTNSQQPNQTVAGSVVIVVIPERAITHTPLASFEELKTIEDFVKNLATPFATIEVRNPIYEKVKVFCQIQFKKGYQTGYYWQLLQEEISHFLNESSQKNNPFQVVISNTALLHFIKLRPYIHFVGSVSMLKVASTATETYQLADSALPSTTQNQTAMQGTFAWSILVAAPSHEITVVGEVNFDKAEPVSLGRLSLGDDFVVQ